MGWQCLNSEINLSNEPKQRQTMPVMIQKVWTSAPPECDRIENVGLHYHPHSIVTNTYHKLLMVITGVFDSFHILCYHLFLLV